VKGNDLILAIGISLDSGLLPDDLHDEALLLDHATVSGVALVIDFFLDTGGDYQMLARDRENERDCGGWESV
jgi:hypothetical protein